jgi:protocatechuate 3,4-dioxygenase beta subunit
VLANRAFAQPGLAATPSCHDGDEATIAEIEGPFFKPRSPRRSDLREPGIAGRPVELSGVVLTRACRPVAGALVDLWQADAAGAYDNKGFRLRGHIFTDAEGRYAFRTIMPGLYPGRTRHYHVKVQAPNRPVLTTQFYFPDEKANLADEFFHSELVMQVAAADDALRARFDVVLAMR